MKNCEPLVFGPAFAMERIPSETEKKKTHTHEPNVMLRHIIYVSL